MFLKLFKYDFKRMRTYGCIVIAAVLLIGVLLSATVSLLINSMEWQSNAGENESVLFSLISVLSMLLLYLLYLALIVSSAIIPILILVQFYKNTASDEGYLTFTLPVSVEKILFSKLLNAVVWTILDGLAIVLSIAMVAGTFFLLLGSYESEPFSILFSNFMGVDLTDAAGWVRLALYVVMGLLSLLVSTVFQYILYFTGIVLGSVVARKHKVWASIGFIVGIDLAFGMLSSIFSIFLIVVMAAVSLMLDLMVFQMIFMLLNSLFCSVAAIALWFLNCWLLKKKLNLA